MSLIVHNTQTLDFCALEVCVFDFCALPNDRPPSKFAGQSLDFCAVWRARLTDLNIDLSSKPVHTRFRAVSATLLADNSSKTRVYRFAGQVNGGVSQRNTAARKLTSEKFFV